MLLVGAPHAAAGVSKSVVVPPAEGKKMFVSFDYRLENSWDCLTYTYLSSVKTCRYEARSDGPTKT